MCITNLMMILKVMIECENVRICVALFLTSFDNLGEILTQLIV
jgi:hypothetical protein